MSNMDPEIQAMEYIVNLEPALRARVLAWANNRYGNAATQTAPVQAAAPEATPPPARKRGRPRKTAPTIKPVRKVARKTAKPVKQAKPRKVAKTAKPKTENKDRSANRLLVYDAIKATIKDGKTDKATVAEFLREKNVSKNLVGNLDAYLKTLENKKSIQRGADGVITTVQG